MPQKGQIPWNKGLKFPGIGGRKKGFIPWNKGMRFPGIGGAPKGLTPWNKGKSHSEESKRKMSESQKGRVAWNKGLTGIFVGEKNSFFGKKHTKESKRKMKESARLKFLQMSLEQKAKYGQGWKGKFGLAHIRYKLDRNSLKRENRHGDLAYCGWRRDVYLRDGFKCRISNEDCGGRLEAHHILSWREYPELRYEVNNGITLCHFHHPRMREEEKRLAPIFQELMTVSNEII